MRTYTGDRTIDGIEVLAEGAPLPVGEKLFSANGFEWGYEGPEPMQLAFALLRDHLGDPGRAEALAPAFMRAVVASLANTWELSGAEIAAAL